MTQRKTLRTAAAVGAVVLLSLALVNASGQAAARPVDSPQAATFVPVSADLEITRTVVGADGQPRTEQETRHLVRDAKGRTRTESGSVVTIADPNARTTTTLDTRAHTYVTSRAPESDGAKPLAGGPDSLRPTISPVKDLGTAEVAGIVAHGAAYTITSPRPNAEPVTKELTFWSSGDVRLTLSTEIVESTGDTYREAYTNIRTDVRPSAEEFSVPAGYRDAGAANVSSGAGVAAADCPLFNAPDPVLFTEFDGGVFVQATTNPQLGCFFSAYAAAFVFPLVIYDPLGIGAGFSFVLLAAVDDFVTPSPCPFLPCPVPGEIVFQARNGNGDVVKDSTVVLTRFTF